jgi:hypothetical protein
MRKQNSLPVHIPSTQVHRNFAEISRRVYSGREHFVVEKEGMPIMAIISMAEYEAFLHEQALDVERQQRVQKFQQAARQLGVEMEKLDLSEDELDAKVEEIRQQLHEKRHGHARK